MVLLSVREEGRVEKGRYNLECIDKDIRDLKAEENAEGNLVD